MINLIEGFFPNLNRFKIEGRCLVQRNPRVCARRKVVLQWNVWGGIHAECPLVAAPGCLRGDFEWCLQKFCSWCSGARWGDSFQDCRVHLFCIYSILEGLDFLGCLLCHRIWACTHVFHIWCASKNSWYPLDLQACYCAIVFYLF